MTVLCRNYDERNAMSKSIHFMNWLCGWRLTTSEEDEEEEEEKEQQQSEKTHLRRKQHKTIITSLSKTKKNIIKY